MNTKKKKIISQKTNNNTKIKKWPIYYFKITIANSNNKEKKLQFKYQKDKIIRQRAHFQKVTKKDQI